MVAVSTLAPSLAAPYDPLSKLRDTRHHGAAAARDVADWLSFLEVANKASRTIDAYERTAARLLLAFPEKRIDEFTDGDLLHVLTQIPRKSRNQHKTHLASFFGWAYKYSRRITENPVDRLPQMAYSPDRVYDIFTEAEGDALCGLPTPDGPLMEILLWGGLRQREACELQVKRLDLDRRQILVVNGAKRSKSRQVPLLARVERAVTELMILEGLGRDDFLWYDRPGGRGPLRRSKPIGHATFDRWWHLRLADAGVRYRRPHLTRHSYASNLRRIGVPVEDLQAFLGHAHAHTTLQTYVHADMGERADRLRALIGED